MIVTGGGVSPDGTRWIPSSPDYLVPVEVLSALFRGRMLGLLIDAHAEGRLQFYGDYEPLAGTAAFRAYLAPLWKTDWFVYAKRPFAGPEQVLAYLSRYTHRVAISNSRLLSADASGVTFKYKDYRVEGPERHKTMTLEPGEFMRRFLMHVLPKGFHRIWHYGLLANGAITRAEKLARARELIAATGQVGPQPKPPHDGTCQDTTLSEELDHPCPHCGSRMLIIETFEPGQRPRHHPSRPRQQIGSTPHDAARARRYHSRPLAAGHRRRRRRSSSSPPSRAISPAIAPPFPQNQPSSPHSAHRLVPTIATHACLQDLRCTAGASEIPIAPADRGAHFPAVSFTGGFRTPARQPWCVWQAQ
jgi:hypothetical protein